MSLDPATSIKAGVAAYEGIQKIREPLLRLRRRLRRGKLVIGILGSGGVGKTTLGSFLDEKFDPLAPPKAYKPSPDTEEYFLKSNPTQSILVGPGQPGRHGEVARILSQASRAKRVVILNVVAYGYHSASDAVSEPVEDYFSLARETELEFFRRIVEPLKIVDAPIKMITVVAKEDLWLSERDTVHSHYEAGEYATLLRGISDTRGSKNFLHEFVYVSLTSHNLTDGKNTLLAPIAAGYDNNSRHASLARLSEVIERFTR